MKTLIGQFHKGCYSIDATLGRGGVAEFYKPWDSERATIRDYWNPADLYYRYGFRSVRSP